MRSTLLALCWLVLPLPTRAAEAPVIPIAPSPVLDLVGNRPDKNSVGHGLNVALYTGKPSKFFYATHNLGDVFSAADGETLNWFPDHVLVRASEPNAPVLDRRQVCVTKDDVVVSRIHLTNTSDRDIAHRVEVIGDCRKSFDWRNKPGGEKITRRADDKAVILLDRNVFPEFLKEGLAIVAGASQAPAEMNVDTPGTYRLVYEIAIPARGTTAFTIACAIHKDAGQAQTNLASVLAQPDSIATNRWDWARFYDAEVPRFDCSNRSLTELYAFRWFLLKFSTAGGDLGFFKYPVVMEGRQAFQTYCCYSAPFMAFDMNWHTDAKVGFGHIANMAHAAYQDGRFPWYTSPRTNEVPLDHASKTGLSLLPLTAWRHYVIHGGREQLRELYPAMKKNTQWWIADRDADGNGLFDVDHQLETGMDDLHRRWKGNDKPARYEAVDATAYALANLRAVASMARELESAEDAKQFSAYADKAEAALNTVCWDKTTHAYRDRHKATGELSDYTAITIFYPLFAGAAGPAQLPVLRTHLLDPNRFWLPHPVPALSKADPEFDPVKRYWAGPSWPAATSHVVEGFAATAKQHDRSLLPQAAELFKRAAALHLQPRADFYERYDPFTGKGLSNFRDYMHSWWIDLYVRHVAGFNPQPDGSVVIDALPLGLSHFSLRNLPWRGKRVDVLYNTDETPGLSVRVDGKTVLSEREFAPGGPPVTIPAAP